MKLTRYRPLDSPTFIPVLAVNTSVSSLEYNLSNLCNQILLPLVSQTQKKMAKPLRSWMQHCRFLDHLPFLIFFSLNFAWSASQRAVF